MKKMKLEEFREFVKTNDDNIITIEQLEDESFDKRFLLVCKKCGSTNVKFFGEWGSNYGGYTGYCEGDNGFKCKDCGNAIVWSQ